MEQLTIKQLLDLGADIDIYFYNCESKEDAEKKVNSLGYDGEMKHRKYLPDRISRGFDTLESVECSPVSITVLYDYVEKLK